MKREFECFICKGVFNTGTEAIMHYDNDEMDEEGEVSLCDSCSIEAQRRAKEKGDENKVSRKFFTDQ